MEGADPKILVELFQVKMPFGKHKGRLIADLPIEYLDWFNRKGFPEGKLGMLMNTIHVVKLNGLDSILDPLRRGQARKRANNKFNNRSNS